MYISSGPHLQHFKMRMVLPGLSPGEEVESQGRGRLSTGYRLKEGETNWENERTLQMQSTADVNSKFKRHCL